MAEKTEAAQPEYHHIPFAGNGFTGHHYISNTDATDQWQVIFFPHGNKMRMGNDPLREMPHVVTEVLTDYKFNTWEIRAVVPTGRI